jgi:hypothetical protein
MYGLGFTCRSTRYTSNGSAPSSMSYRCASTTWKMSPSRMCSFATSTARWYWPSGIDERSAGSASSLRRRLDRHVRQRLREAGRRRVHPHRRCVVRVVELVRPTGRASDALDQVHALAPVVERRERADHAHHRVGQAVIVGGDVGRCSTSRITS